MNQNRNFFSRFGQAVAVAALAAALPACQPNVSERDLNPANTIDVVETLGKPGTVLVDARTPSAYANGHIPGATNLNIADVSLDTRNRPELAAAKAIIVYGQNPGDPLAAGLALRLLEAGYSATRIYRGGVDAWTDNGGVLVTPQP